MTETFTASNGVEVECGHMGHLNLQHPVQVSPLGFGHKDGDYMTALKEYFQHLRDEELGRWRDPENRDVVVYPDGSLGGVYAVVETGGGTYWYRRPVDEDDLAPLAPGHAAAVRYFAAHPLPEPPAPWLDAAPGDVWVLTIDGVERLFRRSQHGLYSIEHGIPLDKWVPTDSVTAGKRIWPVGDGDE